MTGTRLAVAGGRPVVVKRSGPGPGADRLRREAEVLRLAAQPGVVELVALEEEPSGGGVALSTAYVGAGTWADLSRGTLDGSALADASAALATTLATLHAKGIVHGRLTADHVLMSGRGAPVLGGMAEARLPGEPGPAPSEDVASLGALVAELAAGPGGPIEHLQGVAGRARATDPAGRPTMAALAATLRGNGRSPETGRPRPSEAPTPPHGQPRVLAARVPTSRFGGRFRAVMGIVGAMLLAGVGGVVAVDVWASRPPQSSAPSGPEADPESPATTAAPTTPPEEDPLPEQVWPEPTCPPPPSPPAPAADVDGDGCPERVEVAGAAVVAGERRWTVGSEGDVVVLGDWDCDGEASPAALRPQDGRAWVFDGWPGEGDERRGQPLGTVSGAVSARAVDPDGDGCQALELSDASGRPQVLEPPR